MSDNDPADMNTWKPPAAPHRLPPGLEPLRVAGDRGDYEGRWRIRFLPDTVVLVQASHHGGWRHVSVSLYDNRYDTPDWRIMVKVRDLFFPAAAWVVQYHPPAADNLSLHHGCLHLWECLDPATPFPRPPPIMVAPPR